MRRVQAVLFLALSGLLPFVCLPAAAQTSADHNAQGTEHYEAREWQLAIAQFERALELEPDSRVIRRNLSNAYQAYAGDLADAGQYATAIRQLEATIQFDTANPQPLIQLGSYYLHQGLVADAIFRLEEAIELAPDDVDAHFLLGEALIEPPWSVVFGNVMHDDVDVLVNQAATQFVRRKAFAVFVDDGAPDLRAVVHRADVFIELRRLGKAFDRVERHLNGGRRIGPAESAAVFVVGVLEHLEHFAH